jgi:hypothetical protein
MAKKPKKVLGLYVDNRTTIVNQDHQEITVEQARELWDSGEVVNFNAAFMRLATRANWDFDELHRQYAEMDRHR